MTLTLQTTASNFAKGPDGFTFCLAQGDKVQMVLAKRLVISTGGKSIPKMGATDFAYDIARQFGLPLTDIRPALVPFTFPDRRFAGLAGVSVPVKLRNERQSFEEAMLFTHRGLSGPAVLQLSSFWREGEHVSANLLPETDFAADLRASRKTSAKRQVSTFLTTYLPARLVEHLSNTMDFSGTLGALCEMRLSKLVADLQDWRLQPAGTEGYRTAEVALGGIDTDALNSRTMEARTVPGLYFIGEAVDVTGWLGGYNFQRAWSSAMAAAEALKDACALRQ